MVFAKKTVLVIAAALAVTTTGYADLMSVGAFGAGRQPQRQDACEPADSGWIDPAGLWRCSAVPEMSPLALSLLPDAGANAPDTLQGGPVYTLNDKQGSLSWCLYALVSLGLCKSAPWLRRLSTGIIPDWYHHGGPTQIGHSLVISPNCLSLAPICFKQPDTVEEDAQPLRHRGVVLALWRESQFIPTILAPRGPPSHACEVPVV